MSDRMAHLRAQLAHRRLILTERRSDMFEICSELERHMKYIGSKMNDPILFQSQMKTVDELRNMIIEKREEVDRLKNTSEIKKHRLKDLKLKLEVSISCENKYFIEPLPKIQRTISSIYSRLGYLRSLCDSYQQESMDLRQALVSRRQRLLYELTHAFEVENIGGGKRALRGLCLSPVSDLMAKLTSDGQLPLTASAADLEEEDAALGYITLLICQISKILDVPLRMTPVFAGSRSYVWDTRGVLQSQLPECMEYIMEATPGIILGGVNTPGGLSDQVLLEGDIANLQTAIANTGCVRLPLHLGPVPEPKANLLLQQQAAANSLSGLGGGGRSVLVGSSVCLNGEGSLAVAGQMLLLDMVGQLHARQGFDGRKAVGILESLEGFFAREVWVPEAQLSCYI